MAIPNPVEPGPPQALRPRALECLTAIGILTRSQLTDRLIRELFRTRNCIESRSVVLCIDIDRFKIVNASLGRRAGDQLLSAISTRITALLSRQDALARLGGDEFAVLIEENPQGLKAMELAEQIQKNLIAGFEIDGTTVYCTASIGVVRVSAMYESADDILRDAEIAMYSAKERGRARAEVFHAAMLAETQNAFELETDLRRAVERGEFELYYQPIVSIKTGRVRAFESLLRWRHPSRGLQSPRDFMPLLTETGLMMSVGAWVVEEACTQARRWQDIRGNPVPVTINLAPQLFNHSSVVSIVTDAVARTGVHPGSLVLELTEEALVEDLAAARQTLLPLRELGIRTMIDDFGTGYSSLCYLQRLPVDAIKIDASFVNGLERFRDDRMIVRAIIALAHALDLEVVAEGVERWEQLAELAGLNCEEAQGYLLSPPVDKCAATDMVVTRWIAESVRV